MKSDSDFHLSWGRKEKVIDETRSQVSKDLDDATAISDAKSGQADQGSFTFQPNDTIGRYVVVRHLGIGGFGQVVLADDLKLRRQVAIKHPRPDRANAQMKCFLEEGRSVARLDHPSIIKLYNMEETEDGLPFAVMEYVEGPNLQQVIQREGISFSDTIKFLIQIASALQYAHGQTLIHRDLKPANVIISHNGQVAKLMDFGLALHDLTPEDQMTRFPEGTPPYMSPEQMRGENHRLDARTDIWGFGVMMYIMLTGKKPFNGANTKEIVNAVCFNEPAPLRAINKLVPPELQRICLKCIEKLMGARYQNASQLLDDLKHFESNWQMTVSHDPSVNSTGVLPSVAAASTGRDSIHRNASVTHVSELGETRTVKVVPKGLRSFDGQDAEFFVDLLPGPKDRFGIPDSLRFWLSRIADDSIDPLTVGMVFGPSGCGKSSFVKAGLIPHLPNSVKTVYLEATPDDMEQKLLSRLEQVAPGLANNSDGLAGALRHVRRGQLITGTKLLIVIDQFEQWLHNNTDLTNQPLIDGLRQCDGQHLCCLLMVRDDFWMSATQFMAQLDLKVQDGVNALGIPLFDRRHARKVLAAYGRAFNAVDEQLSANQSKFISDAVAEIAEDGKIIPIHLALFAQMTDSDSWDAAHFKRLGGWHGIGVQFLQSILSDKRKSRYESTCRAVLQQLLPESASDIKGTHKSLAELAHATGHADDRAGLQDTLDLLDREMRIITPTESDDEEGAELHYQLAHDYLVRPIRTWLSQKERETWQGRAKIRLKELADQWQVKHDNRFLPSPFGYIPMLFGVDRKACTENQRAFLRQASKFYGIRMAVLAAVVVWLVVSGWAIWSSTNYQMAKDKFDSLLVAPPAEVSARLELLEPFGEGTIAKLISAQSTRLGPREKLHVLFARSHFVAIGDIPKREILSSIAEAEPGECINVVAALRPLASDDTDSELFRDIRERFDAARSSTQKIRLAVVALHLGNVSLASELLQFSSDPELREQFIDQYSQWHGRLDETIQCLDRATEPAMVIGLLKSLGQIARHEFSDEQYDAIERVVDNIYQSATSPGTYSAARWFMNQYEMTVPTGKLRASNGSWFVKQFDSEQVTFLKVDPQFVAVAAGLSEDELGLFTLSQKNVYMDHEFYMSAHEVRASLFFRFMETLPDNHPTRKHFEGKPIKDLTDKNLPIFQLSFNDAVEFCNWLSDQDQRSRAYRWNEEKSFWEPVPNSGGYRLPTDLEWDAANRMGTATRFFFGNSTSRLDRYAVIGNHLFPFVGTPVSYRGQKMPNDNGFFDMVGNVNEYCQDVQLSDQPRYHKGLIRGGHAMAAPKYLSSGGIFYQEVGSRLVDPGIRLVVDKEHSNKE